MTSENDKRLERLKNLSPAKRALLLKKLRQQSEQSKTGLGIPKRPPQEAYPLSFAQQRIWFIDQLDEQGTAFNMPAGFRMRGRLDLGVLTKAINTIVDRHEILRTVFIDQDGQPRQKVVSGFRIEPALVDCTATPPPQREHEIHRQVASDLAQSFDLGAGPLIRTTIVKFSDDDHLFLVTGHHIVFDGWSWGTFMQEFAAIYRELISGQPSSLPDLDVQYPDYAVWETGLLASEFRDRHLTYWKRHLEGAPQLFELPVDRRRALEEEPEGAYQFFRLPSNLSLRLKEFCRDQSVTLFMALLATFKTLLCRYAGVDDIVVGSPFANRIRPELENLIGCFMNPMPVRTKINGDPTFRELLARVRESAAGAFAHQELPFDMLVKAVQPKRDRQNLPLFQVMFLYQNYPWQTLELPDLQVNHVVLNSELLYPIALQMAEDDQGIVGVFEYDAGLFDSILARTPEHLMTLLQNALASPDARLSELKILTERERNTIVNSWNQTAAEFPKNVCLHQLFEAQAVRTPQAVAVRQEGAQLTYGALNARANQLAHHLIDTGVLPGELVGLCCNRSIEMVISLLGILKAGAAYLPIDPQYPQERIRYILDDAGVKVLLTTEATIAGSQLAEVDVRQIVVDRDGPAISQKQASNANLTFDPESLAYVIYTSGSTGNPKGVMISHRAVVNYTFNSIDNFALTKYDRVLQFASISFDTAAEEIYPTLAVGATLVLRNDVMLDSIFSFLQACEQWGITLVDFPTAYWHEVVEKISRENLAVPPSLRFVILGGEKAQADKLATWHRTVGTHPVVLNTYGPTESTIVATTCDLAFLEQEKSGREAPIGKPIKNARAYVLDKNLRPVPIGVKGELCVGGAGLAHGYLNRPDLTAERFVPNPFREMGSENHESVAADHSSRLYQTGDIVRYLADGNLEYHGRSDSQVKIRGYRIELGEIEATLNQHPEVEDSVVLAKPSIDTDGLRLRAYVVPHQMPAPTVSDIRRFLAERLPDYMAPHSFVFLEALPLTTHGKIDTQALPEPDTERPELDEQFIAPRSPVETALAEIWCQVLHLEQVGVHDNFFELGGDSIISLQIITRAREAGLKLTARQVFERQTIAELAEVAGGAPAVVAEQGLVSGEVPLTPIQHSFFAQDFAEPHHFNQAAILETHQSVNYDVLRNSVRHLMAHHDALRLRYEHTSDGWRQYHCPLPDELPVKRFDLSGLDRTAQSNAFQQQVADLQASLDLTKGPLLQVALFEYGDAQPGRVLIVAHHLIVDGVSWRILLEDLDSIAQQLLEGEPVRLLNKTTSFKQWAERINSYAESDKLANDVSYWLDMPPTESLPVDFTKGENIEGSTATVTAKLDPKETSALLTGTVKAYKSQINEILLSALAASLRVWTSNEATLVTVESHGRDGSFDDVDLSRTAGWFTAMYPVRLAVSDRSEIQSILDCTRDELRRIPNRGLGFSAAWLSDNPKIKERLNEVPPSQILFNYLGQFNDTGDRKGLFRIMDENVGPVRSPMARRSFMIEINSLVIDGCLKLVWTYSTNFHRRETVARLADEFLAALKMLIAGSASAGAANQDLSEFGWDQGDLDEIMAEIGEG